MDVIVLLLIIVLNSNEILARVVSCEGFVKSDTPIDLSLVQLKLYTSQGNLKYEAECNPQSGYFLIPIYNKGRYSIKLTTPKGWIFSPKEHKVDISDNGGCEGDFNFELLGFEIFGTVVNDEDSSLLLGLYDISGRLVAETRSDRDGHYSFVSKTGTYTVSAGSESSQCMDRGRVTVEVKNGPVQIKPDIKIAGHSIHVMCKDEWDNPLGRSAIILRAKNKIMFENIQSKEKRPQERTDGSDWLYSEQAGEGGDVHFRCIPVGQYTIEGELEKTNMKIRLGPRRFEMRAKAKELVLTVGSFVLEGRVHSEEANGPISGVNIFVDGLRKETSDDNGLFVLGDITPGKRTFSAQKKHFEFEPKILDISSKIEEKVFFRPTRIALCGSIVLAENLNSLQVNSVDGKIKEEIPINMQGEFCGMLRPTKYIVKLISPHPYTPKQIEVDLRLEPTLGLRFTQLRVRAGGKVDCFAECSGIKLELWQANRLLSSVQLNSSGLFEFEGLFPAFYQIKVVDSLNIWWDTDEQTIQLTDKDVTNLRFNQKGYQLEIRSSHPLILKYTPKDGGKRKTEQREIPLAEGSNIVQFKEPNTYSFTFESCHDFTIAGADKEDSIGIPSAQNQPILLTAINSLISVAVIAAEEDSSLKLVFLDRTAAGVETEIEARQIMHQGKNHTFLFKLEQTAAGRTFVVQPSSNRMLFSPKTSSIQFDGQCHLNAVTFRADPGKFIRGLLKPPIEGVNVKARHRNDPNFGLLETFTDSLGQFMIGPVRNVEDFALNLTLSGFVFTPDPKNAFFFNSVKLSKLMVSFLDAQSRAPLPEVLVSMSSSQPDFRASNVTDKSGFLSYLGLAPNTYFIRPILQEYKFDSSSYSVTIAEGETKEMILEARRYAYSVFGKVSTIGSRPFHSTIRIEAISTECENHQEEDFLDKKMSTFRLRGLKPQCSYKIWLKDEQDREIKAFPPFTDVKTGNEDKFGINFLFIPYERLDSVVIGELELEGDPLISNKGYRIVLMEAGKIIQEQIVHEPASIFMFTLPEYNKMYSIGIDQNEANRIKIEPVNVDFFASSSFNYIKIVSRMAEYVGEAEVQKANYIGLALILVLTLAFFNQKQAWTFIAWASKNVEVRNRDLKITEDLVKKKKAKK